MQTRILLALALAPAQLWAGQPTKHPAPEERGATLYAESCAPCHGATAMGDGPLATATRRPAPKLAAQVRPSAAAVQLLAQGQGEMPGFGERYDDDDLKRILIYLSKVDANTGLLPKRAGAKPSGAPPAKAPPTEPAPDETPAG